MPLQVFMQSRPPADKKGRMIAVMNQANWIGILLAVAIYWALTRIIEWQEWPRSIAFLFIAATDAADRTVLSSQERIALRSMRISRRSTLVRRELLEQ